MNSLNLSTTSAFVRICWHSIIALWRSASAMSLSMLAADASLTSLWALASLGVASGDDSAVLMMSIIVSKLSVTIGCGGRPASIARLRAIDGSGADGLALAIGANAAGWQQFVKSPAILKALAATMNKLVRAGVLADLLVVLRLLSATGPGACHRC